MKNALSILIFLIASCNAFSTNLEEDLTAYVKIDHLSRYIQIRDPRVNYDEVLFRLLDKYNRKGPEFLNTVIGQGQQISQNLSATEQEFFGQLGSFYFNEEESSQLLERYILNRQENVSRYIPTDFDYVFDAFINLTLVGQEMEQKIMDADLTFLLPPELSLISNQAQGFYQNSRRALNQCYDRCSAQAGMSGVIDLALAPLRAVKATSMSLKVGLFLSENIIQSSSDYALSRIQNDMNKDDQFDNFGANTTERLLKGAGTGINIFKVMGDMVGAVNNISESAFCTLDCDQQYELDIHNKFLELTSKKPRDDNSDQDSQATKPDDTQSDQSAENDQQQQDSTSSENQNENESEQNSDDSSQDQIDSYEVPDIDELCSGDDECILIADNPSSSNASNTVRFNPYEEMYGDNPLRDLNTFLGLFKNLPPLIRYRLLAMLQYEYYSFFNSRNTYCDDKYCLPTDIGDSIDSGDHNGDGLNDTCVDKECLQDLGIDEDPDPNPLSDEDLFCMDKICLGPRFNGDGDDGFFNGPKIPIIIFP